MDFLGDLVSQGDFLPVWHNLNLQIKTTFVTFILKSYNHISKTINMLKTFQ
jgi:hypothetical protein